MEPISPEQIAEDRATARRRQQQDHVDIVAWGIAAEDTFRAVTAVLGSSSEVEVNPVDAASCSPSPLQTIEEKGVEL